MLYNGKSVFLKSKNIIYLTLVIVWMLTVYIFSSQNGEQSQKTSNYVTEIIVKIVTFNNDMTQTQKLYIAENMDYIIRKFAHFSIYLIGGMLIYNYINTFDIKVNKKIIISIMIGELYAAFDEFHQYFVSGRSAQILDVCIDSLGIITGIILISLIKKWGEVYHERKSSRNG